MVAVEAALRTISQHGGCLDIDAGKLNIPSKALGKEEIKKAVRVLKKAGPDKVKAVLAFVPTHCLACQYHDTGPTPDGKDIIYWCGPFKKRGDTFWLNIAELIVCPLGKWGDVSKTVH